MKELLFYDIECYPYNIFVVFKNRNKEVVGRFFHENNFEGLNELIKGKKLVGYNNYHYDDYILTAMMKKWTRENILRLNNTIIAGANHPKLLHPDIDSYDCFQQISISRPGLKKIEGNLGMSIIESAVDFNINRPLTPSELDEVVKYCEHDIDATIEVFNLREKSYFETKETLVDMVGNKKAIRWNTTTISAILLTGNKAIAKNQRLSIHPDPERAEQLLSSVPQQVREMWEAVDKEVLWGDIKERKVEIEEFGNIVTFGFGGLHSAPAKPKRHENVKLLDVASMYPNIILNQKTLGKHSNKYQNILNERLAIKHTDKKKSDALKLILNSVYGNLNNQYSYLYNTKGLYSVCIYGQIALYNLAKSLYAAGYEIVQCNTDGVAFTGSDEITYKQIWKQWESEYNLALEEDTFDKFIQKDVNNYIGLKGDKVKTKGGEVNLYDYPNVFKNVNGRIIHIALVDYLLYGTPIMETLNTKLNQPELYQYILQAGKTYVGTFDNNGKQYNKINRVFAAKEGVNLMKLRRDKGYTKYANAPENMFVWNDDIKNLKNFEQIIDLEHYYKITQDKLKLWEVSE